MSNNSKIVEGVFAINKPPTISSAQVLRDLQKHFNPSALFAPWLAAERARRSRESHHQRARRRDKHLQVKLGHGGTLDPLATGVLIVGAGSGTKRLQSFLACTKSYEAAVLFGAATDSYDAAGRAVARAAWGHVTREGVEAALGRFRGRIMQRPPLFSALSVDGKRLYEYAREGKEVPREIQERPVEVLELELVEWLEGGAHGYRWPEGEAGGAEKEVAGKLLGVDGAVGDVEEKEEDRQPSPERKRKRTQEETLDKLVMDAPASARKKPRMSPEPVMSGAIHQETEPTQTDGTAEENNTTAKLEPSRSQIQPPTQATPPPPCPAPAARLRMTVTSGFYVRSLCHDLGAAVGSLGLMSALVRTRQGDFELGKNVLEYDDLAKGEEVWGPKVKAMLEEWTEKEGDQGRNVEMEGERQRSPRRGNGSATRRRNSSSPESG